MDSQSGAETKKKEGLFSDPSHIAELLRAAAPYITEDIRSSLDFLISTLEFSDSMKKVQKTGIHLPTNLTSIITDMEGLLKSVRSHCTDKERELVDMFLNIVNAQNFYRTYSEMASMFKDSTEHSGSEQASEGGTSSDGNEHMMEMLTEMLSPEQKNAFEAMKMMMG